jgi:hypothetical protein
LSFYRHFGGLDSLVDGSAARTYRTHIAPLYSSKSADGLVPRLRTELEAIASRLQRAAGKDEVINIQQMFRTLSVRVFPAAALDGYGLLTSLLGRYGSSIIVSSGY